MARLSLKIAFLALLGLFLMSCKASLELAGDEAESNTDFQGCLEGAAIDEESISISFDFPSDAQQINIYRDGALVTSSSSSSITSYIDRNLREGQSYTYTCEAIIKGISKTGASILTLWTDASSAPSFTGIKAANALSATSTQVTWNSVDISGPAAAYYQIYGTRGGAVDWATPVKTVLSGKSTTLSGLGDELPYVFGVRACTYNDICDTNTISQGLTLTDNGFANTVGITNGIAANGTVTLTAPWLENQGAVYRRRVYARTGSVGGTNLSDYTLMQTFVVSDLANPPTSLLVAGILENTEYHFIVQDEDPTGNFNPNLVSHYMNIGDLTAPLFAGISSLTSGTPADTQLDYSFSAITSQPGDPAGATSYVVYANMEMYPTVPGNACDPGATVLATLPATSYTNGQTVNATLTGLTPRMTYDVCIKAVDAAGNESNNSNHITRTALDITPPTFDGAQTIVFNSSTGKIDITWNGSVSPDVKEYQVKLWKNTASPTPPQITTLLRDHATFANGMELSQSDFTFGDLEQVYVTVNACDDANILPGGAQNCNNFPTDGTSKNVVLPDVNPPAGFTGIQPAVNLSSTVEGQMLVPWNIPGVWGVDYRGFRVYMVNPDDSLSLLKDCNCVLGGSNLTCDTPPYGQCTLTGLDAYRTYEFHVRAYDASGNETQLDVNVNTSAKRVIDETAPTFSSNLQVGAPPLQPLSWQAATDNQYAFEPGVALNYKLYRKDNTTFGDAFNPSADGTLVATETSLSYTDSSATMGITVFYAICAEDSSGNETCDGNVQSRIVADSVNPVVVGLTHNKVDVDDKDWDVSWTNFDNVGVIQVDVYKKITDTAETLLISNIGDAGVNLEATGGAALVSRLGETGPANQNKFINYLVVATDAAGNKGSSSISVYSKNMITVTSISRNEGNPAGGKMVIIVGDGFSPNMTIKIGGNNCTHPVSGLNQVYLVDSTEAHCVTPAQSGANPQDVLVENTDGSAGTLSGGYSYASTVLCDQPGSWGADFAGGIGTPADPYVICTGGHLDSLRNDPYHDSQDAFELQDNINMGVYNTNMASPDFLPLSNSTDTLRIDFDGGGYVIGHFSYIVPAANHSSLFGYSLAAKFEDLTLVNFNIEGGQNVAAFFGECSAIDADNIDVKNSTIEGDNYVGSICGISNNNVANAQRVIRSDVTNGLIRVLNAYGGGIFGENRKHKIIDSHFSGTVQTSDTGASYLGGIAGDVRPHGAGSEASVTGCSATGVVDGGAAGNHIGGVVGYLYGNGANTNNGVYSSWSSSSVSGNDEVGGVIGRAHITNASGLKVYENYFTGSVSAADDYAGGVIGYTLEGTTGPLHIRNSYSDGIVNANGQHAGGVIGGNTASNVTVDNVYATGAVDASGGNSGGLVGSNTGGLTINDSFWYYDAATPSLGTTQATSVGGGTAKTLTEMQAQSTFDPPWDFTTIWQINAGEFPTHQ